MVVNPIVYNSAFPFEEAEQGKAVSIAPQWQNESGERGDYSEIESVIIP
jgi:hypothetical protein